MQSFCKYYTAVGKFTAYKLPLKSMPAGTHEFEYTLGKQFFTDMESSDIRDANVAVKLVVDHKGDTYALSFKFDGEVTLLCDRCLDDLFLPIDTDYHILVKYGDDYRDDNDDILEIPESDAYLNIAYMMYDTVSLAIPIKHVHPMGKCNRAMSALLRKHRTAAANDEDAALQEELIDEMDSMDAQDTETGSTDPRWDKLKDLKENN